MNSSDRKSGLELVSKELRELAGRIDALDPSDIEGMSDAAFQADICTGMLEELRNKAREERDERARLS